MVEIDTESIRILKSCSYYSDVCFGSFLSYFSLISEEKKAIKQAYIDQFPWRKKVLEQDLDLLLSTYEQPLVFNALQRFYSRGGVEDTFKKIIEVTQELLSIKATPPFHIVDSLPGIFADKSWDAMSVDSEDELKFRIKEGLYYKKQVLTHGYFEFIIAHEVIHWMVSQFSKKYIPYTSPLEEGLCDYLSAFLLFQKKIVPSLVVKNFYIFNRSSKEPDDLWATYWSFCKKIDSVAFNRGVGEIIKIIKNGRDNLFKMNISHCRKSPKSSFPDETTLHQEIFSADNLILIDIDSYIALQTSIIMSKDGHIRFDSIQKDTGLPSEILKSSIVKLVNRGLIVQENKNDLFQTMKNLTSNIKYTV